VGREGEGAQKAGTSNRILSLALRLNYVTYTAALLNRQFNCRKLRRAARDGTVKAREPTRIVPLPPFPSSPARQEITGDLARFCAYLFSPSHFRGGCRARRNAMKRDARPFRDVSRRDASRRIVARDATIALVC